MNLKIEESKTLCLGGMLMDLGTPKVMGILNVTSDSFFDGGRYTTPESVAARIRGIRNQGADIIDVGACSTRPGSHAPSEEEEYSALARALDLISREWPEAVVSVDTFRASVAARCASQWGSVKIINDISGGGMDTEMFGTVATLGVAYVLTHSKGTPETMQTLTDYEDVTAETLSDLSRKLAQLRLEGVADVIVDPGFGFAKTTEQNFRLLAQLDAFRALDAPLLVGVSRKSMICKTLSVTPHDALNGTTALNMAALLKGAGILRVHDVREAVQTVRLFRALQDSAAPHLSPNT